MGNTRIIHTADTHLGYKQYNNMQRRQDFFDAFERIIDDAIRLNVDAVVHTGDLFDSRTPNLIDVVQTIEILKKLKIANIPFFGIVGNHESKQDIQWLDLLEQMDVAKRLDTNPTYINDVAIYGIDYIPRTKLPTYKFNEICLPNSDTRHTILAMHQLITEVPYGIFNHNRMIGEVPFNPDALILGDYHKYYCDKVGDTWVTYPGSTERHSSDEFESRSYNILTCNGKEISIQRKNIITRNFVYIDASISKESSNPIDTIIARIRERMDSVSESVVIIDIDGDYRGVIPYTEIDEYLLSNGAIVCKCHDRRFIQEIMGFTIPDHIVFLDPDKAVDEKLRQISLTEGGEIADNIIRNMNILKTKVESEIGEAIEKHIKNVDFDKIDVNPCGCRAQNANGDENDLDPSDNPVEIGNAGGTEISETENASDLDDEYQHRTFTDNI